MVCGEGVLRAECWGGPVRGFIWALQPLSCFPLNPEDCLHLQLRGKLIFSGEEDTGEQFSPITGVVSDISDGMIWLCPAQVTRPWIRILTAPALPPGLLGTPLFVHSPGVCSAPDSLGSLPLPPSIPRNQIK